MISAAADPVSTIGIYLYGLARPECLLSLDNIAGLGLQTADSGTGLVVQTPVTALACGGTQPTVIALISEVTIADFSESNLQTLSWVGARAGQHEAVVAAAMHAATVLPVKFGTIFRSIESLQQFMEKHGLAIDEALGSLRGKAEWSVKGYLVEAQAREIFAAQDPVIASRRAALSDSPGARYMQQKQIAALAESALENGVTRLAHDLLQGLQARAEASRVLRCHASKVTGRPETMIFNASFLLSEESLADFQRGFAAQQEAFEVIGLALELRGPWPPYNFCPDLSGASL